MGAMAPQITSLTFVHWLNRLLRPRSKKHQSSASLAFGIHRWPVNSPHKWPVTRKMFPFDDVIMIKSRKGNASALHPFAWGLYPHLSDHWRFLYFVNPNMLNKQAIWQWFGTPWRSCDVSPYYPFLIVDLLPRCILYICNQSSQLQRCLG